jgi:Ca2+-transporting ATPase
LAITGSPEQLGAAGSIEPHAREAQTVLRHYQSNAETGLDPDEAQRRLREHGLNELAHAAPIPWWRRLAAQFTQIVVWILIVAAIIAGLMSEWLDTTVILAIVVLNGLLGFFQEEKAARSLAALRKMSAPMARVRRGGKSVAVPGRELVPGDVVELEAGDHIPADARLIQAFGFQTQEAALTGESTPIEKFPDEVLSPATLLGDRRNMVYLGTLAVAGKAVAVVTATGMETELGRIAGMLKEAQREPTPLERRLEELGRILVVVCLALIVIVFVAYMLQGGELLEVLLLSVSLAVAAVPEGLPGVVTICLALGVQRMVRRNALVRKLPSVETLGSVTVICSDKTGTLTRNEMTVRQIVVGARRYEVTGSGYTPQGEFLLREDAADAAEAADPRRDDDLLLLLTIAARCNNARLLEPAKDRSGWTILGDPTEGALLVAAAKAGVDVDPAAEPLIHEIPFDPERRTMSVVRQRGGGQIMYTKGALEAILPLCVAERRNGRAQPLTDQRRRELTDLTADMAAHALRVLALACRDDPRPAEHGYQERELTFAGLIGMIDPPREEARQAIGQCRTAGIRPMMITGDHPATAAAIATDLGLAQSQREVVTGQELNEFSDAELASRIDEISVVARASAVHKLKIVEALKRHRQVVAMTGDGINDAPAVKSADIGIAMGITGTDVTKDASDMVLVDDNFASIVGAVAEGRRIYDNIQKVIHYLLSCNAGEVAFMFVAALVGWPAPLVAIQILWINLVTDGLPAIALALDPPDPDLMQRPPRPKHKPVITPRHGLRMARDGLLIAAVAIISFALTYNSSGRDLFYAFSCRSQHFTLPRLGLFSNRALFLAITGSAALQFLAISLPATRTIFRAEAAHQVQWPLVIGLALVPVTIIEVAKIVRARQSKPPETTFLPK